jgi:hypothetical protein
MADLNIPLHPNPDAGLAAGGYFPAAAARQTVIASAEVIISAGAFHSP